MNRIKAIDKALGGIRALLSVCLHRDQELRPDQLEWIEKKLLRALEAVRSLK